MAVTVFELTPTAGGGWTEKVLHSFTLNTGDGVGPQAGLVIDAAGNLYGTTVGGGAFDRGSVFELTPGAGGTWTETVLYSFGGGVPQGSLILDAAGNLYGTTYVGGVYGNGGTVFELRPKAGGGWTKKVLHSFNPNNGKDGHNPVAGLIFDTAGNLYGTTYGGGAHCTGCGTVFELTRTAGGGWKEKILHSFSHNSNDGFDPVAGLILDAAGNLYGTTAYGGANSYTCDYSSCGTVFPADTGDQRQLDREGVAQLRAHGRVAPLGRPDSRRGWELVRHDRTRRHWLWVQWRWLWHRL
jgi:uncharacterized repeat protein (TIGR03803 family)